MNVPTKIHASILVFIAFLLLHYIVSSLPLRFDLTADRIFTLSPGTRSLLEKVEEPVSVTLYTSRSMAELPPAFKAFAVRVEKMLEQYARASGGKLRLRVVDPRPDTSEEEAAIAAGLHGQEVQTGERVFLGMVAAQGDTESTIPFFNWNRENFLEYDISKSIFEVQQFSKPRIGLLTSLPLEAQPMPPMPGQQAPADQHFLENLRTRFEVVTIEPGDESLPSSIDLLALIHPKDLNEALLYQIDQFVLSGKPAFVAVDPSSLASREQSRQMQMMGANMNQDYSSDLPQLLAAWGLDYSAGQVLVDPGTSVAQPGFVQPAWLILEGERINKELLPASSLEGIMVLEAGSLAPNDRLTANWEPVLTTSEEVGSVEGMFLQFTQPEQLARQAQPLGARAAIAGMLSGPLSSAFPDGPPTPDSEGDIEDVDGIEGVEDDADARSHLPSGESSVFVIADTDWLMDQFSISRVNFLGMQAVQKINDNQDLAANFVEFVSGSRDLIGIRGKGSARREFTVVKEMEAEAQRNYQRQLENVEAELASISQKISELAQDQQGRGFIVATPEIEAALQENRETEARLMAERRAIRRELRQDIERLGYRIGAINLLWAPIALAAFGIYYSRRRKNA